MILVVMDVGKWYFEKSENLQKFAKNIKKFGVILFYAQTTLEKSKESLQVKIFVWTSFALLECGNKLD
jgi:hypothetical protein